MPESQVTSQPVLPRRNGERRVSDSLPRDSVSRVLRRAWRALAPVRLRRWREVLVALAPAERRALLALEVRRRLQGLPDWRPVLRRARSVSFVCHGNIIRSPFAAAAFEGLVRERGHRIEVRSAGVAARNGEPADPRAAVSAQGLGWSLTEHRATLLDAAEVNAADVLVVMDRLNLARILARFPEAEGRVLLLAGCRPDGRTTLDEIHDPVAGTLEDVRRAHGEVLVAVRCLVQALDPATT